MRTSRRWEHDRWQHKMERMQRKMDWMRSRMAGGRSGRWRVWGDGPSSGNHAFDEYRSETLKRLEEEQHEFRAFLDRLRFAKDKTEFDAFMAERRNRPEPESPADRRTEFFLRRQRPSAFPEAGGRCVLPPCASGRRR